MPSTTGKPKAPDSTDAVTAVPKPADWNHKECCSTALWLIIAGSLTLHVGCLVLSSTVLTDWRWKNDPVHAALEVSGSLTAFMVALLLVSLDQRKLGTSYNIWISAALIGMGLLDGLHALVYVGQPFVWLHSLATFIGGVLFNFIWLPERLAKRWWPLLIFCVVLTGGIFTGSFPELTPAMLSINDDGEKVFSGWAIALNVGGGVLLITASVQLFLKFRSSRNTDDLLFCLHCVLFGAAAIMFEQSQLWDLTWWGWHVLRFLAYAVALWFIVLTLHREQQYALKLAEWLQRTNETLEEQVRNRTADLEQSHKALGESYQELLDVAARERQASAITQSLMDSTVDAIVTYGVDGLIESINRSGCELLDHSEEHVIGMHVQTLFQNPHAFDPTTVTRPLKLTGIRSDQTEFPCEVTVGAVVVDGRRLFTCGIRDITAQTEAAEQLARINRELIEASRKSGMADVASGILHNVGNVLNSVNVTANLLRDGLANGREERLSAAAELLLEQGDDLGSFLTTDRRGRHLPQFLKDYAASAEARGVNLQSEADSLLRHIDHIRRIIEMQQKHTQISGIREECSVHELMVDSQLMAESAGTKSTMILREFCEDCRISTDRHKTMMILVNLIRNAHQAVREVAPENRKITLSISGCESWITFAVCDAGVGFPAETANRLFEAQFTTKDDGHGFGLHSSSNAAGELGGSLTATSDGVGQGACFKLQLPRVRERQRVETKVLAAAD